ncbi:4Fe-4S dicluster domain-containing protein [Allopusillimonas soli]|uniref:4Fe-4S dicluster domain-containing protein n=1 Tax=Allopusillimonas soli TaxID=659016 RepID=A0A853F8V6_9BURK|nr:4Fe-4S dicluster domain-containing protein [Allopusillimonas soli]NYT35380.1 4Fe-4S dicluster domain-containing protein [Allopusillimonas soli]TEA75796.1 4Fe-4S dicluster domain-containing protein [Allopusillimonas soli]
MKRQDANAIDVPPHAGMDNGRRRVLKLLAASAALAGAGCSQAPQEKILPYVSMPEGLVPGDPVFYASTLLREGYGVGVLVEAESGRPIKIEGNTLHPASLGAADAQSQASVLTLWDPERSHIVMKQRQLATWDAALDAIAHSLRGPDTARGSGLRLLTGPVSSPTLLAQIGAMKARYPEAVWHVHDPAGCDAASRLAKRLFGGPARTIYHLDRARVVLAVDADLFGPAPDGVRNAHDFMQSRRGTPRAHLYALESAPGLCGALADHRVALSPAGMEAVLEAIAAHLGVQGLRRHHMADAADEEWVRGLAAQLRDAAGTSVVAPGSSLSEHGQLLAWQINAHLGNLGRTLTVAASALPTNISTAGEPSSSVRPEDMSSLVDAMRHEAVNTLIMLDVNPVYDAPGSLDFQDALQHVPCSVHMGLYADETAHQAVWHIPMTHELESWSDARSFDGTPSIIQPVISPLYGGRSPHTLLNLLAHGQTRDAHACVRETWRSLWRPENDSAMAANWETSLRQGVVVDAQPDPALNLDIHTLTELALGGGHTVSQAAELVAVFANDSNIVTGRYANNTWLQELPRPYTKISWDNAALMSPATARRHGIRSGDIVSLSSADAHAKLRVPVWVQPGHADGVVTLPLGYGRRHGGSNAHGRGFDAYPLLDMQHAATRRSRPVLLRATGDHHAFARTQHEMTQAGREPVRTVELRRGPAMPDGHNIQDVPPTGKTAHHGSAAAAPSLYPAREYDSYAWGMSVDLDACIGCNACTLACQAENNIPVVGPEEVARGREMHWIRVDLYWDDEKHKSQFQPMACQHCENAPCEVVCPVGATMHDSEGLNVQVYNRCVGTRFCSNNCPYKVRHFNFFDYASKDPSSAAHANPDVTVRQRGVMEKCTYCLQRISHARIEAQKSGRAIQDGEVVTACQATCPTQAIVFGDTNDPQSRVSRSKASPRNYAVLDELNTRPRTTYLARIDNPLAKLGDGDG